MDASNILKKRNSHHVVGTTAAVLGVILLTIGALEAISSDARAMPAMSPAYSINPCYSTGDTTPTLYGDASGSGSSVYYSTGYQDSYGTTASAFTGSGYSPPGNPYEYVSEVKQFGEMSLAAPIYNNMSVCDEDAYSGGGTNYAVTSFTVYYQYSGSLSVSCLTGDPNPSDSALASATIDINFNLWDITTSSYVLSPMPSTQIYYNFVTCSNGSPASSYSPFSAGSTLLGYSTPQFTLHANNDYNFIVAITTDSYAAAIPASVTDHTTSGDSTVSTTDVETSSITCSLC